MSKPEDEAVAIVGYGGVFPGAGDPEGLWANIVEAVDATTEVPPGRWLLAPAQAFDLEDGSGALGGHQPSAPAGSRNSWRNAPAIPRGRKRSVKIRISPVTSAR